MRSEADWRNDEAFWLSHLFGLLFSRLWDWKKKVLRRRLSSSLPFSQAYPHILLSTAMMCILLCFPCRDWPALGCTTCLSSYIHLLVSFCILFSLKTWGLLEILVFFFLSCLQASSGLLLPQRFQMIWDYIFNSNLQVYGARRSLRDLDEGTKKNRHSFISEGISWI